MNALDGDDEVMVLHKLTSYSLLPSLEYVQNVKVSVAGEGLIISLLKSYRFREIRVVKGNLTQEDLIRRLKGVDVVLGGYGIEEQKELAIAASELGMPFITYPIVTTILPDGIGFEEIRFPWRRARVRNASTDTITRSLQVLELIKVATGIGEPVFPPRALEVVCDTLDFKVRKVRLKVRSRSCFRGDQRLSSLHL